METAISERTRSLGYYATNAVTRDHRFEPLDTVESKLSLRALEQERDKTLKFQRRIGCSFGEWLYYRGHRITELYDEQRSCWTYATPSALIERLRLIGCVDIKTTEAE